LALISFSTVLTASVAAWTLGPGQAQDRMPTGENARMAMIFGPPSPVTTSFVMAQNVQSEGATADLTVDDKALNSEPVPTAPAVGESQPLDRLSIVRQSVRRAGLGSRAIASLVLRNANDYPVKDISVRCAFARVDGQGSTERVRMIERTLKAKSREALPPTLIGHITVMAPKGKCSLVAASRA
jgi:hypothetical protein